jgi:hypothetical protein
MRRRLASHAYLVCLTEVLTHLIVARGFTVIDLYTGEAVSAAQIENLPRVIAS